MSYDRFLTRVWDTQENRMIYDNEFIESKKPGYLNHIKYTFIGRKWIVYVFEEDGSQIRTPEIYDLKDRKQNRFIVMGCLGECDKKGALIYEKDILVAEENNEYYFFILKWNLCKNGLWTYPLYDTTDNESVKFPSYCKSEYLNNLLMEPYYYEIIGNIYQNPEFEELDGKVTFDKSHLFEMLSTKERFKNINFEKQQISEVKK